ncbi:unnamed protein product [Cylindrotheca closterium]|uniref:Uncharacterized protein n=1 Tax=Cylindrotheca closterium TaxID=2856 RepID=A0AAD2CRT0_9STRA|nr:unnamed protein product [Cylindrotheca closterium]
MPLLSPLISKVAIHMSSQELQPYPLSKTSSCASATMFNILRTASTTTSHQTPWTTAEVDESVSPSRNDRVTNLRPRRVTFKPTVTVRSIPHFNRYPQSMKKKIWNSSAEIYWNARRNKIEFKAEGCDWRNVVTEDQMHVDVAMGELIHPCHVSSSSTQQHQHEVLEASGAGGGVVRTTLFPTTRKVQGELILC